MLRVGSDASEDDLRLAVVECGRICYARKLITSNDGNISARIDDGRFLITPSGVAKGRMHADDLLILDADGGVVDPGRGGRPSSETPMHLEVYRHRRNAGAVIHAHPVFATALTVAGMSFPTDVLPETLLLLGEVPVTRYASPSTAEDAAAVRPFVRDHSAILLRQHGTLTIGADLEEALLHLERLEHAAEVFWRARALGNVERLTPEARRRLRASRDDLLSP
jgi:L-fuculose-phosphate aldolase